MRFKTFFSFFLFLINNKSSLSDNLCIVGLDGDLSKKFSIKTEVISYLDMEASRVDSILFWIGFFKNFFYIRDFKVSSEILFLGYQDCLIFPSPVLKFSFETWLDFLEIRWYPKIHYIAGYKNNKFYRSWQFTFTFIATNNFLFFVGISGRINQKVYNKKKKDSFKLIEEFTKDWEKNGFAKIATKEEMEEKKDKFIQATFYDIISNIIKGTQKKDRNILIFGKSGSGKTYFTSEVQKICKKYNVYSEVFSFIGMNAGGFYGKEISEVMVEKINSAGSLEEALNMMFIFEEVDKSNNDKDRKKDGSQLEVKAISKLLPIMDGTELLKTKFGNISCKNMTFIALGAFSESLGQAYKDSFNDFTSENINQLSQILVKLVDSDYSKKESEKYANLKYNVESIFSKLFSFYILKNQPNFDGEAFLDFISNLSRRIYSDVRGIISYNQSSEYIEENNYLQSNLIEFQKNLIIKRVGSEDFIAIIKNSALVIDFYNRFPYFCYFDKFNKRISNSIFDSLREELSKLDGKPLDIDFLVIIFSLFIKNNFWEDGRELSGKINEIIKYIEKNSIFNFMSSKENIKFIEYANDDIILIKEMGGKSDLIMEYIKNKQDIRLINSENIENIKSENIEKINEEVFINCNKLLSLKRYDCNKENKNKNNENDNDNDNMFLKDSNKKLLLAGLRRELFEKIKKNKEIEQTIGSEKLDKYIKLIDKLLKEAIKIIPIDIRKED